MNKKILILGIVGLILSMYITYFSLSLNHDETQVCDINEDLNCSSVYNSPYSLIFGISISIYGIFFYFIIIYFSLKNQGKYLFYLSILGVLFSAYLTFYVELYLIGAFCVFCLGSALVTVLLLIFSYQSNSP